MLIFLFIVAALSQASMWKAGLYTVSADESARAIMAATITPATALDSFIWLPFYKIFVGIALKVYNDLFITPRAIAFFMGLATLASLGYLAKRLFNDQVLIIISLALGILVSHRVIFGAIPQSEMFYNFFIIMGFAFYAGWLDQFKTNDLLFGSAFFAIASLVRYEGWFISAFFGITLAFYYLFSNKIRFSQLLVNGIILSFFPLLILGFTWLKFNSIDSLFITSVQHEMFGAVLIDRILHSHGYRFMHDVFTSPILLALIPIVTLSFSNYKIRFWVIFFIGTLLVVTLVTILTGSVAYAAPWRLSGAWTLMLLPFLALFLKNLAFNLAASNKLGRLNILILPAMTIACMASFAIVTFDKIMTHRNVPTKSEFAVGSQMRQILNEKNDNILLVAESYSFLNLIVLANYPERIILNTGSDPLNTGLYVGYDDYWKKKDPQIYENHLAPKYDLLGGGDMAKFVNERISHIVTPNPAHRLALEKSGNASLIGDYGSWFILAVKSR